MSTPARPLAFLLLGGLAAALWACGNKSTSVAEPAPVEIEWPDAAVVGDPPREQGATEPLGPLEATADAGV